VSSFGRFVSVRRTSGETQVTFIPSAGFQIFLTFFHHDSQTTAFPAVPPDPSRRGNITASGCHTIRYVATSGFESDAFLVAGGMQTNGGEFNRRRSPSGF
jgi:hypothetical protein